MDEEGLYYKFLKINKWKCGYVYLISTLGTKTIILRIIHFFRDQFNS